MIRLILTFIFTILVRNAFAGDEPVLVFTSDNCLYVRHLDSEHTTTLLKDVTNITQFAFGPDDTFFWIDSGTNAVLASRFDTHWSGTRPETVVDSGLRSPNGLTVDWVRSMLYLVDTDLGQIILCTTIGSNCVVLVDNLVRPHDVTIDFKSRELIWSEWGTGTDTGSIHKCLMDSSGHTVIVGSVRHPTSLVLDTTLNSLYWTAEKDAGYVVQMIKLGTHQERKDIHQINNIRSGSQTLSILGDSLYLVDEDRIVVVDKVTGHGEPTPVETDLSPGAIVAVYHPVVYQTGDVTDGCDASPCSHVCVPSNSPQGYKCLCPTDMELVSYDKCHTKNVTRIVTSGAKGIYEVPLQYVGSSVARAKLVLDVDADCLAYDSVNQVIVFHDELEKSIKTLDVKNGGICRTVYKHIRHIEDLAIDTTTHNLYWTTRQSKCTCIKQQPVLKGHFCTFP